MSDAPLNILLDGDATALPVARLGAALVARGHRVFVLDAPKVVDAMLQDHGAVATLIPALPRWLGPLRKNKLRELVAGHRIDVVHVLSVQQHGAMWTEPGAPPMIATVATGDLVGDGGRRSAGDDAAIDAILSSAGAVTADNLPVLRRATNRMGASTAPREQVLWGSDLTDFDRIRQAETTARFREQLEIQPEDRVLMSPRPPLTPYHVDRIVAAFAVSEWPKHGVLVIKRQGKPGEDNYVNFMLQLLKQRRVHERARVAPRVTAAELPALLAMADAAVSMPVSDGVPRTYLELMALEVPIIAWNLSPYEGVLVHNERGALLAGLGDQGGIIDGINTCLHDEPKRRQLGVAARQWVLEHGDWGKSVDRWEAFYRRAIAHHVQSSNH